MTGIRILYGMVFTFRWCPYTATKSEYSQIFYPGHNHFCTLLPSDPVWDFDWFWTRKRIRAQKNKEVQSNSDPAERYPVVCDGHV